MLLPHEEVHAGPDIVDAKPIINWELDGSILTDLPSKPILFHFHQTLYSHHPLAAMPEFLQLPFHRRPHLQVGIKTQGPPTRPGFGIESVTQGITSLPDDDEDT